MLRNVKAILNYVLLAQDGEIGRCPEYDPLAPINRVYERKLYDYYGRPVYWR